MRIEGTSTQPITLTAQKGGKHIVWIYKATEAHTGAIIIQKVTGNRLLLQSCLTTVKHQIDLLYPSDKSVALYFFEPMQAHGCSGHPSVEDHAVLAKQLVPFFKRLL